VGENGAKWGRVGVKFFEIVNFELNQLFQSKIVNFELEIWG